MSSKIFDALLEEKIDLFVNTFIGTSRTVFFDEETKRLRHSGEFGIYREKITHDFLKYIIPQKFSFGNGFIISNNDEVSTQCDIIMFDRSITPLIQSSEHQTFYPVETVVAVGEVKSTLSKTEFVTAINKLSKIKKIKSQLKSPTFYSRRDNLGSFDPQNVLYDGIFTFIICEKLNFKLEDIENELNEMYEKDVNHWNRHNLILSIEDGLFHYNINQPNDKLAFWAPTFNGETSHRFTKKSETDKYHHFKSFAMCLFNGLSFATVLLPEMVYYMNSFTGVNKIDNT